MKHGLSRQILLCLAIALSLTLVASIAAQPKQAKQLRIEGTIKLVAKDTITVLEKSRLPRPVLYDAKTQITFRNKPAKADALKEGARVICLGKQTDKKEFLATRIDIREQK